MSMHVSMSSNYLSMLTSSLVTKELLSPTEACCFFVDSSSNSTWDRQRGNWTWCTHTQLLLARCLVQTFWLEINPENSILVCCYLLYTHTEKTDTSFIHHLSTDSYFPFHNNTLLSLLVFLVSVLVSLWSLTPSLCNYPSFPFAHHFPIFWQRLSFSSSKSSQDG